MNRDNPVWQLVESHHMRCEEQTLWSYHHYPSRFVSLKPRLLRSTRPDTAGQKSLGKYQQDGPYA